MVGHDQVADGPARIPGTVMPLHRLGSRVALLTDAAVIGNDDRIKSGAHHRLVTVTNPGRLGSQPPRTAGTISILRP